MPSNLAERAKSDLARRWNMTDAQLELLRRMIHPEAPDDVIELYLVKCRAVGADPLDKVIYVIPRRSNVKDERTGEWRSEIRWTIQGSIDLFRSIAEQSGDYAGQLGPFWSNDGEKWSEVWLDPVPPKVCKVGVLRNSFREPLWVTGTYEYYVPRDGKGNPSPTNFWKGEKGAHQLAKCVEELALRKAFPRKLQGVYGSDEMAQAPRPVTQRPKRVPAELPDKAPDADDAADAYFEALQAPEVPSEPPTKIVTTRSSKPEEYRRKSGIGAIHALCKDRNVSDQLYRDTLVEMFGVERFKQDDGTTYPTSAVLDVPELEQVWLTINERTKSQSGNP